MVNIDGVCGFNVCLIFPNEVFQIASIQSGKTVLIDPETQRDQIAAVPLILVMMSLLCTTHELET